MHIFGGMVQDAFQALADEGRREILFMLAAGNKSTAEICQQFTSSRQAVNKHLAVLVASQLIKANADGRAVVYKLDTTALKEIKKWMKALTEKAEASAKKSHLKRVRK